MFRDGTPTTTGLAHWDSAEAETKNGSFVHIFSIYFLCPRNSRSLCNGVWLRSELQRDLVPPPWFSEGLEFAWGFELLWVWGGVEMGRGLSVALQVLIE